MSMESMSMEKRLLLACVVSAVIFIVWMQVFPPPKPAPRDESGDVVTSEGIAETTESVGGTAVGEVSESESGVLRTDGGAAPDDQDQAAMLADAREAAAEEIVTLENDVIAVRLTNRGAAVSSLKLLQYESDDYDGLPLELVQDVEHEGRTLPLQLRDQAGPDQRMYEIEAVEGGWRFVWADGLGNGVEKTVRIAEAGYGLQLSISRVGALAETFVSAGTGMRNSGPVERGSRLSQWGDVAVGMDGELERFRRKKVKEVERISPQIFAFAGFEDTYFLSVLRPSTRVSEIQLSPVEHAYTDPESGETELERVVEVCLRPATATFEGELLSVPKEYDLLQAIGGGVQRTIDFGIFNWFSVMFLKALRAIHGVVNNWGLAIILLTLGIRIVLFPLMHKSTVSMRRMAKLQPKVKAIQAKYKKAKSDQQARAKMSQETMELYREEGVNPMGGCLPLLVQLPILWALYQLFLRAIELRHAPFFLWITDLSAKDPYFVTPILMTATMWLQQKLSPQVGDPQHQRIFKWMPLIFGVMFLQFPSGLVLYWLANNVITIIQQEITLRLIGERGRSRAKGGSGKGKA